MNQQKKCAEFKALAREQLLGNYGKIAGAFAIITAIYFAVFFIAYGAGVAGVMTTILFGNGQMTKALISSLVIVVLIMIIIVALFSCMAIGLFYMSLQITRGNQTEVKDVFFSFTHHPDKALGMFFILYIVNLLMMAPAIAVEIIYADEVMTYSSPMFFLYLVLYLAGLVGSVFVSLNYGLSYIIYCDHPEMKVLDCLQKSRILMQGQKGRMFYIYLSFIGWYFLMIFSFGLAMFWIGPYMITVMVNFYRELCGELNETVIEPPIQDDYSSVFN